MSSDSKAGESVRKRNRFLHSTFGHIIVAIAAAALVGVGVWGYMAMSASRDVAAARGQSRKDVDAMRVSLDAATRDGAIREAQVRLYESALELERRNFGSANSKLREAGGTLDSLPKTAGAGDDTRVATLQKAIAALDLTVVTDVSAQRNDVLDLAEQAGELVSTP